ncbi:MAG: hypothetical protein NC094_00960 [Bacteroidales bacterium]|nr:hypothetical protein [Lachnoclostridium sp.]MCM1382983.1 hypothetical protein [Lachnoclostridium sp.]MCM1463963.1 hypothetical protein [Bacteroidales bacterium]
MECSDDMGGDYSEVKATAVCGNDPAHTVELNDIVITREDTSTCVNAGVITYTGTVTLPDETVFTDTKTTEGTALGHSFLDYILNSDGSETAKCDRCGETHTKKSDIKITDKTNTNVKVDVGGLNLNMAVENLQQHNVEITLQQEAASEKNTAALKEKVGEGYESVGTFEIRLLLSVDGGESKELTEGFGSVHLSLPVGMDHVGKKAIVYQLHGNEVILHNNLIVDAEGDVTFAIDKLSTFMAAVEEEDDDDEPDSTSSDGSGSESSASKGAVALSPKTGENTTKLNLWMAVCVAGALVCAVLTGVKSKQK